MAHGEEENDSMGRRRMIAHGEEENDGTWGGER